MRLAALLRAGTMGGLLVLLSACEPPPAPATGAAGMPPPDMGTIRATVGSPWEIEPVRAHPQSGSRSQMISKAALTVRSEQALITFGCVRDSPIIAWSRVNARHDGLAQQVIVRWVYAGKDLRANGIVEGTVASLRDGAARQVLAEIRASPNRALVLGTDPATGGISAGTTMNGLIEALDRLELDCWRR